MAIIVVGGGVAIGKALISNFFAWIFAEAKLLRAQTTTSDFRRPAAEKPSFPWFALSKYALHGKRFRRSCH